VQVTLVDDSCHQVASVGLVGELAGGVLGIGDVRDDPTGVAL
jgi:hypothetical protein